MTDIPGTGKFTPQKENKVEISTEPLSIINVRELKTVRKPITDTGLLWYDKFYFWLIIGFSISLLFFLISLRYKNFFIFIPLGPITSIISWYIKGLIKKYEPKAKKYSS